VRRARAAPTRSRRTLQESRANPAAIEKPGSTQGGIGLWQHTGHRRHDPFPNGLEAFAAHYGKSWSDPEIQVRFVAQELTGPYAHAWSQIRNVAQTLEAKTETAMGLFEGPANWQEEIKHHGTTTAGEPTRFAGAKEALAVIQAAQPGAKKMDDVQTAAQVVVDTNAAVKRIEDMLQAGLIAKGAPSPLVSLIFTGINALNLPQMLGSKLNGMDFETFINRELPIILDKLPLPPAVKAIATPLIQHFNLGSLIGGALKNVDFESLIEKALSAALGVPMPAIAAPGKPA
jgi:hypothetical protein